MPELQYATLPTHAPSRAVPLDVIPPIARGACGIGGDSWCSVSPPADSWFPLGTSAFDCLPLEEAKFTRRRIRQGQSVYESGQEFGFVYAVRSGTLKSSLVMQDGREQVSGFEMAGDLLGLDGLATGFHATTATALEDVELSAVPYLGLAELAARHPHIQLALTRRMSWEIVREHRLLALLAGSSAEQWLAAFLLDISDRMKARGYSATEFHLRMTRSHIGSYLGMSLETVSRTLSSLQRQRLLVVDKRHVRALDIESLRAIAGPANETSLR